MNNQFKGTKGIWVASHDDYKSYEYVLTATNDKGNTILPTDEEAEYNAKLISKSKELLNNAQMHIDALDLSNMEFYDKYGINVSELIPITRQLIIEATNI